MRKQPFKRSERVADLLRQAVSEILMSRVQHAGLEEVTVTGAKVSDDLQHARVYYRVLNLDHKDEVAKRLELMTGTVRKELGHQMKLRYTPELKFEYDRSLEYGHRIDQLLNSIHRPGDHDSE